MRLAIIFSMFSICLLAAQKPDMSRSSDINRLAAIQFEKGADTLCVFEKFDENDPEMFHKYVISKKDGKTVLNQIGKPETILSGQSVKELWEMIAGNMRSLKEEKMKFFSFKDGDEPVEVVSESSDIKEFKAYISGEIADFFMSGFDFQEYEIIDDKKVRNVNFEHNQKLTGKKIIEKLDSITKDY